MSNAIVSLPVPENEPVYDYAPQSPEREQLQNTLKEMAAQVADIPAIIGGEEIRSGDMGSVHMPHDHGHQLATFHRATPEIIVQAEAAAASAKADWESLDYRARASIFLKMAELTGGKYRMLLNASTMLGQSKTPHQAEIDAAAELVDFYRFNVSYLEDIYSSQPISDPGLWNYVEYRALEGFVMAVTPFNFTSIGGNLPTAPALMGNTVLWKPASTAVLSGYYLMQMFREAGMPDGVINFVPGAGSKIGGQIMDFPSLAGIHFTGSTEVFQLMWKTVGDNIKKYRVYPRVVGETGGKNFVVAHPSADVSTVVANLLRGAFEYQGQKCSAASRAYLPRSLWAQFKAQWTDMVGTIQMGDPSDFKTFMGAVIDKPAFESISSYIDVARESSDMEILTGGGYDDSTGYFIEPTTVVTTDPHCKLMEEEIFGPVLTLYVYPDDQFDETLELCDSTSPYALTGAIFAQDRFAVEKALRRLRHSAGNFYINDKPTGAVVGQQPFGGSRASGTNDKAGSAGNLTRWTSMRTVKETFVAPTDYRYPYME